MTLDSITIDHDEGKMWHSVKHSMYLLIPAKNEKLDQFLAANSIGNFSPNFYCQEPYSLSVYVTWGSGQSCFLDV